MTAPLDHFRPGEAGFMAPAKARLPAGRPTVGGFAKIVLAIGGVAMVPVLAVVGSFMWFRHVDHACAAPAPVILRGSLAPEADLAKLEMPEDVGR